MNTKKTTHVDDSWRNCSKCKVYKTWDFFYKAKTQLTWYSSCCKECSAKTIEVSRLRKPYTYRDKTLLEMEKLHKNKENKIIWWMCKKSKHIEIEKMTTTHKYKEEKPYWNDKTAIRIGENYHPIISKLIK